MVEEQEPFRQATELVFDRRVNLVSLANLVVLAGILITALASWYGMVGRVDTLSVRVDSLGRELSEARTLTSSVQARSDGYARELQVKSENISTRLSVVETHVGTILSTVSRMELRLDSTKRSDGPR